MAVDRTPLTDAQAAAPASSRPGHERAASRRSPRLDWIHIPFRAVVKLLSEPAGTNGSAR